jgi:hypothetical protein
MANKNAKRTSVLPKRRQNRTETKAACLQRTERTELVSSPVQPLFPNLTWKLRPNGTWEFIQLH